jgi:hypothetical protein
MHKRHLLTHAAAMGGWLTASYIRNDYEPAAESLVAAGLMEWSVKDGHRQVIQLTTAGQAAVAELRGAR